MTTSSSGGLFRVGPEWFVDAAMLQQLARRGVVEPMLGGYQLLMSNSVVRFSPVKGAPLPGQAGLLFRCHHPDGSNPAANLRFVAGSPKGEWSDWPRLTATADCGCHHKTPAVASAAPPPCACKTKPVVATMSAAGHLKIGTTFLALRQLTTNDGEPADWLDQDAAKQVHCTGCGTPVISTVAWSSDEGRYRCEECEEQYPLADAVDPRADAVVDPAHDDDATGELASAKASFIRRFKDLGDAIDAEDLILNRGVDPALYANFPQYAKDVYNRGNKAETAEYWRWLLTQHDHCEVCNTKLEHMGASGIGCPRCADRELDELDKQALAHGDPPSSGSRREFSVPTLHEAGRFGSRGSRLNDQDLDLAELSEITTGKLTGTRQLPQGGNPPNVLDLPVRSVNADALTFPEAYNILLEAVGEGADAIHPDDEHDLSRQHVRALADREIQLQQSVLALLDVLMPGCQTQIYEVDELDHIEFMTNTLDDLTRRISQAGADEEAGEDDAPNLLADLRAIVHNNVEEVEG